MKIMIVVTHLLGTGHLARALTLARAFQGVDDRVCVVSGGMPAPLIARDFDGLVQLPPVRSDGVDFTTLLGVDGAPVSGSYLARRQSELLACYDSFAPDVLITELFPFGRRILRDEFTALLSHAKGAVVPPLICASIRDILAPPSKPKKATFADEMVLRFYDAVLVHADPDLTPLDISWPVSKTLAPLLRYTGFVTPPAAGPHPDAAGTGEIIVSAGGGDVGGPVYAAALGAAALSARPMRILVGGAAPRRQVAQLRATAPAHVVVEPARTDFRQMLTHAAASVSLCGYNTALDILQAGTPAVFIPFDEGAEVEQGLRAGVLSRQNGIATLPFAELTPDRLNTALDTVLAAPPRAAAPGNFDGAAGTVAQIHRLRQAR